MLLRLQVWRAAISDLPISDITGGSVQNSCTTDKGSADQLTPAVDCPNWEVEKGFPHATTRFDVKWPKKKSIGHVREIRSIG